MGRHAKPNNINLKKKVALGATMTLGAAVVPATTAHAAVLTPSQVASYAKKGCPQLSEAQVNVAVKIAGAESGLNTNAHNPRGEDSRGLWQINLRAHDYHKWTSSPSGMFDPLVNARAMCSVSNAGRNWGPWTTYTSGAWKSKPGHTGPADPPPPPPSTASEPPDAEDGVYVVKPGDWLSKIAATLGVEGGWKALYDINKDVIGPNPNVIHPGMKLTLPGHEAPAEDPYEDGLPQVGEEDPSAKPLQRELKRVGILDKSIPEHDNYGPATQAGVTYFHRYFPQFSSKDLPWHKDNQIGSKGWTFLRGLPDGGGVKPTPPPPAKPSPKPPPSGSYYVLPVKGLIGDGLINNGGCVSRSCGGHSGLDISAPQGTPVVSATAGTVVSINSSGGAYGNHVVVKHAGGVYTLYAHLSSISVSLGQSVGAGQKVGTVGSTGDSSGPHLHFEVRNHPTNFSVGVFLDPVTWLRSHGVNF